MRNFCALLVATGLITAPTAWAEPLKTGLAPGKPAGVRTAQAEDYGSTLPIVLGIAAIGIGIGLAVSGNDNKTTVSNTGPVNTTTP